MRLKKKNRIKHLGISKGRVASKETRIKMSINRSGKGSPVIQYTISGDFIAEFKTISEAAIKTNSNISGISRSCLKQRKTSNNFIWTFKNKI